MAGADGDQGRGSDWSAPCYIAIDDTVPASVPTISSPNYPPNRWNQSGDPITFQLNANGTDDVGGFEHLPADPLRVHPGQALGSFLMETTGIVRRRTAERVRETLERLAAERDVWVSTAHPDHGPHQVPLWFLWDGRAVWLCTGATSVTARNVREEPRVRLSLPDTFDVVLVQGEAECFPDQEVPEDAADAFTDKFGWDPRAEEGSFLYVRVVPTTVRAWRGTPELRGRVIMRDGIWLSNEVVDAG